MSKRRKRDNGVADETIASDLKAALSELPNIEVLDQGVSQDRVRILMRIHDDSTWLPVLKLILREERRQSGTDKSWSVHVCRQFMLRPDNDEKLGFAWNFILRSPFGLRNAVTDIRRVIDVAKNAITFEDKPQQPRRGVIPTRKGKLSPKAIQRLRGDLSEYPLMAREDRNMPEGNLFEPGKKQRGAHFIGGS